MNEPRYFEDIEEGMILPPLRKEVTLTDHLRYHIVSRATGPMHIDLDYARSMGLPGMILCGHMRVAHLAQLVTDWIGEWGTLKRIAVRQKAFDTPGHPLVAKGRVTRKYVDEAESLLDLDAWIENESGERTCEGSATVALPLRGTRPAA